VKPGREMGNGNRRGGIPDRQVRDKRGGREEYWDRQFELQPARNEIGRMRPTASHPGRL